MKIRAINSETRCRADSGEVTDPMLPRKASAVSWHGARTPNRHRWAGREYQGDRENCG